MQPTLTMEYLHFTKLSTIFLTIGNLTIGLKPIYLTIGNLSTSPEQCKDEGMTQYAQCKQCFISKNSANVL